MTEKATSEAPKAEASADEEQKVDPKLQEAVRLVQQGTQLFANGKLPEAEKVFREALALKSDLRDAKFNLGVTLRDLGKLDEASEFFASIVAAEPRAAMCQNNLGYIAAAKHDYESAERHYRQAIEDHFQLPIAHFNLGQLLLQQGSFLEGWKECEWRWQTSQFTPFCCLQPRWDGSALKGKLLLHTEQGIGDVFQFVRFLPEVRKRVERVMFVMPENLLCMFRHGDWADELRTPGEFKLDEFAAYLPLLSAPYALKLATEADHGMQDAYLTPEPRTVHLGEPHVPDCKLKVGLAWAGSPTHANDRKRSIHAKRLLPLLQVPHVAFYSLQKGPQVEQLKELTSVTSLRDLDSIQKDFADGAAIARQLDLIISVDTSVLHLAGGLRLPAWCLLSDSCDWRWMRDREDSYWYPTVQLFRQRTDNDWEEVIQRVAQELSHVVAGTKPLA